MSSDEHSSRPDPDTLLHVVSRTIERDDDELRYLSEESLGWLAEDLRSGMTSRERERLSSDAAAFARITAARIAARRVAARLPLEEVRERPADETVSLAEARTCAARAACVALLPLSAAAGIGRALWEEPCESWLEVRPELADAQHIALSVAGDSMMPVLRPGDVIIVKLGVTPAVDDLVVARLDDDGYVVKRVSALRGARMELSSLNPDYEPMTIWREGRTFGVVIARCRRAP